MQVLALISLVRVLEFQKSLRGWLGDAEFHLHMLGSFSDLGVDDPEEIHVYVAFWETMSGDVASYMLKTRSYTHTLFDHSLTTCGGFYDGVGESVVFTGDNFEIRQVR